ncbi:MAG TPA: ubiquinol-cytochrome C chaperone family protein [Candidatus Cybelea sp.]|nr:ubiquinol-cytochrome C chaperone family protein [Candidatus Cybelea sp.]
MKLFGLFRTRRAVRQKVDAAHDLYAAVVGQARRPEFYAAVGVPDTLDGRFELIALHVFLILHRLKSEGEPGQTLGQALFDTMWSDMDQNLREMGAADLGVGRRIKAMATGFYGRTAAYDAALRQDDTAVLSEALRRNLYGTVSPADIDLDRMTAYVRDQVRHLASQPRDSLAAGKVGFTPAPATRMG